jgi:thioredoxin reductase (NADPH)
MVTSEEIAGVPLFASLSEADRQRLSRACADMRLASGEYVVHEGEERALYVVLDGCIEVVKVVDGIERVLGERLAGAIFGEVPITLGASFPSGFRAARASRVMQIEAQQ